MLYLEPSLHFDSQQSFFNFARQLPPIVQFSYQYEFHRTMTTKALKYTLRPSSLYSISHLARRNFITLPGTEAQSLTATRLLPYKSSSLYKIIADVDSYSSFLPYCTGSSVTKWSSPDTDGKRWPSEADLEVGWGGYQEIFTSRLFCIPGSVVEALSGEAVTNLSRSDLSHHSTTINSSTTTNNIFKSLSTRWVVKPFHSKPPTIQNHTNMAEEQPQDRTEVHLTIDFQFANPIYAALSKAVAPKVAGIMIEAFEVRANSLLGGSRCIVEEKHSLSDVSGIGKKVGV